MDTNAQGPLPAGWHWAQDIQDTLGMSDSTAQRRGFPRVGFPNGAVTTDALLNQWAIDQHAAKQPEPTRRLVTTQELAAYYSVTATTVGRWKKTGKISPVSRVRPYRYDLDGVIEVLGDRESDG